MKDSCPLREIKGVCGDGGDEPVISSYHPIYAGIKECYVRHVMLCWNEWRKIANRYIPSIHRLLENILHTNIDLDILQKACNVAVLHHDVGKLSMNYQSRDRVFYRHELLSSYLIHGYIMNIFKSSLNEWRIELLSSLFSAVIYLHHEGLQISHRHYEIRAPTYGYLLNILMGKKFYMVKRWRQITSEIERWLLNDRPNYFEDATSINGYEAASLLGSIITIIDGDPDPLPLRLAVASILQPLMISDNLAALSRGGKPSRLSRFLGAMEK